MFGRNWSIFTFDIYLKESNINSSINLCDIPFTPCLIPLLHIYNSFWLFSCFVEYFFYLPAPLSTLLFVFVCLFVFPPNHRKDFNTSRYNHQISIIFITVACFSRSQRTIILSALLFHNSTLFNHDNNLVDWCFIHFPLHILSFRIRIVTFKSLVMRSCT